MSAVRSPSRPVLEDLDLDMPKGGMDPEELRRRASLATMFESPTGVAKATEAGLVKAVRTEQALGGAASARPVPPPLPSPAAGASNGLEGRALRSEERMLSVRLPDYVQQELRVRAARDRTTVRILVLEALQGLGIEVRPEDMTDDRGIVAKMRSKAST